MTGRQRGVSVKRWCFSKLSEGGRSKFRHWGSRLPWKVYRLICPDLWINSSFALILPSLFPSYWRPITLLLFPAISFPSLVAQPNITFSPETLLRLSKSESILLSFNCCSSYCLYCYLAFTHMMLCTKSFYVSSYSNLFNFLKLFKIYIILVAHNRYLANIWLTTASISWHFKIYLFKYFCWLYNMVSYLLMILKRRHDKTCMSTINLWNTASSVTHYLHKSEIQKT